jgi:hypothetical protein
VKTGANDASSPAAMGMVINIATPTGGDQYHGAYAFLISPRSWNDSNNPGGSSAISQAYQPDFAFRGPLKRGKAWFFASGRYIYRSDGIARTEVQLSDLRKVVPDFEPFDNEAGLRLCQRHGAVGQQAQAVRPDPGRQPRRRRQHRKRLLGYSVTGAPYLLWLSSAWTQKFSNTLDRPYNNKGRTMPRSNRWHRPKPSVDVYSRTQPASGGTLTGNTLLATLNNAASRSLTPAHRASGSGGLRPIVSPSLACAWEWIAAGITPFRCGDAGVTHAVCRCIPTC